MRWDETKLAAAKDQHEEWLMKQRGVIGTAIGYDRQGQLCLKILTDQADAAAKERIRARLKGIPVSFEQTGPIEAQ